MASFSLVDTGKFSVLEAQQLTDQTNVVANVSSVCTGNRKVPLDDFVAVASLGAEVELDKGSMEKLAAASPSDEQYEFSNHDMDEDSGPKLSEAESRGALYARLIACLQGRAGLSAAAAAALAGALNAGPGAVPRLPAAAAGAAAAAAEGAAVARLLAARGHRVTVAEAAALRARAYGGLARAALTAQAAAALAPAADAVAALTCEMLEAPTEPFDSVHFDICRQHRGQMAVAETLRLFLEGSKRATAADASAPEALRTIPQTHGPAREAAAAAARALATELASAEASPAAAAHHPAQTRAALARAQEALSLLAAASTARLALLSGGGGGAAAAAAAPGTPGAVRAALARELAVTLAWLAQEEKKAAAAGGSAAAAPSGPTNSQEAVDARAAAARAKEDAKLAGMTPEQRAKVEAKRRAKEEKAAAKAAKKAAKKAGGDGASGAGASIGVGNQAIVQYLLSTTGGNISPVSLREALGGLGAAAAALAEKLSGGGARRKPKIAKGTRDFLPEQMRVRERAFNIIRNVFKLHGAVEIETPVFELTETLKGKYGEDSKLIYDLADQGGELLSLRYDLTVPFARYLALHSVGNIKRYHIARVYRRDQPNIQQGRFREFYQCDFDIAGSYAPMVPDAEVLSVAAEILSQLPIGDFEIKINHRKLLDSIFDVCGVPEEKFRMICSSVDKLDKLPWAEVKKEMTLVKGLREEVADRIGEFVVLRGEPWELLARLKDADIQAKFNGHQKAAEALADMELLFQYLEAMGSLGALRFDLSLARGLDYYTGVIYECLVTSGETKLGSIGGGGRYDNLVGMFSVGGQQIPCVGVSIGIDRLFTLVEQNARESGLFDASNVQVLVASVGEGLLPQRMALARELWARGVPAEFSHQPNAKLKRQLEDALARRIPFMVIIGEDEIAQNVVKVKDLEKKEEETVPRIEVAAALKARGCKAVVASAI